MKKIVIFGVGLIGGSLALALKAQALKAEFSDLHIVGIGRHGDNLQDALDLKAIDTVEKDVSLALKNADLVIIATPVAQTPHILTAILPYLESKTVITDVGSTKSDVVAYAQEILGEKSAQFIAGHPIAGAEKSGATAAKADLFLNKNIVLTPSANANKHALQKVRAMWLATGANVSEMTALQHDSIFAAVSHLPHLLAFALVDELASRNNAQQLFDFAASGFRDFTRIAGSSSEMWRDISIANKTALISEIEAYQTKLYQLKQLLSDEDGTVLQALFERASLARNNWANGIK